MKNTVKVVAFILVALVVGEAGAQRRRRRPRRDRPAAAAPAKAENPASETAPTPAPASPAPATPGPTASASASTPVTTPSAPAPAPATPPPPLPRASASEGGGEGSQAPDAGSYAVRLRDLEQRINELKEQIFRSKARLSLLAETVLRGTVSGSRAIIVHNNRMGATFKLVRAVYSLDGAPIFNRTDEEGSLSERETFEILNGSIVPGDHTLSVNLEFQGWGYGIFSYLKGYHFRVRSQHTFTAPEGKTVQVQIVAYEKGGPTTSLEDRPAIQFNQAVSSGVGGEGRGVSAAPGGGAAEGAGRSAPLNP